MPSPGWGLRIGIVVLMAACAALAGRPATAELLRLPWPDADAIDGIPGESVRFPSHSPFSPIDIGTGAERDPPTEAVGTLFLPPEASAARPVPAVVILHGSGGVQGVRELTYGRQFAAMGVAALVVDAFAARRDHATGFTARLLAITETMMLADAYAGLRFLAARPEIDGSRVALVGFSYGGMAAVFAAHAQIAAALAPDGQRFAAHAAFYAPCVARFDDTRATGAPVLMMMGGRDAITDRERCAETAADLRAGGAQVETVVFPEAFHQWDGGFTRPRMIGRNLSPCRLRVDANGRVHDLATGLPMTGPLARRAILALCVDDDGYMIGRDDDVRERSNAELGRFLAKALAVPADATPSDGQTGPGEALDAGGTGG